MKSTTSAGTSMPACARGCAGLRPVAFSAHETFHRPPGVQQRHAVVVNDVPVLISRILLVPGLKCKWSVNEVEIQIVEPESVQTRLESRFDALGPMIRVGALPSAG